MRKLFAAAFLFLCASAAYGQGAAYTAGPFNTSGPLYVCTTPVTTTPCTSFATISGSATLSPTISNPYPMTAGQAITFYVAPGQYAIQMPNAGFSQIVTIGGGNSATLQPNQLVTYSAPNCGTQTNCYPANWNSQYRFDAVTTSNTTITCADCHFLTGPFPVTPGTTVVWTVNSSGNLSTNETTISSVTNDTTIQIASPSSSSLSSQTIVWGIPDVTTSATGGLVNAWNASNNTATAPCGTLILPQGVTIVEGAVFNTEDAHCTQNIELQNPRIDGAGRDQTILIPSPNFVWTTCGGANSTCFSPPSPTTVIDEFWSIYGANYNGSGYTTGTHNIIGGGTVTYHEFAGFQWCYSCATVTGMILGAQQTWSVNAFFDEFGFSSCNISANGLNTVAFNLFCNSASTFSLILNSGASFTSYNGIYNGTGASGVVSVPAGTTMYSNQDSCTPGFNHTCFNVAGTLYMNNTNALALSTQGLYDNGGTVYAQGSTFAGGTGTGLLLGASTSKFIDLGGNNFTGTTALITETAGDTMKGAGVLQGSCTGTATSSTTLGLYGLGQYAATTCTSAVVGSGQVMSGPYTLASLQANASAGGVNASSGVVTVLKNGSTTTITCTLGTGTSCVDTTHSTTGVAGDIISIQFTTQTSETLANVKAHVFSF